MNGLSTRWSAGMGLAVPILNAPMGSVAGGALAAAVSGAGGLGMIGIGSAGSTATLERELKHLSDLHRPFGIGLIGWSVRTHPALLDTALAREPALLSVSFGEEWSWVQRARDRGCATATQVADPDEALRAAEAGVEVLIARGAEGGGHGAPRRATLPLLRDILAKVELPVLAAGGIASGRSLAAVLEAGASGAWIGTAFAACPESTLPDAARSVMLAADGTDTVVTRVFDVALGYPWPASIPERVIRNAFTEVWASRDDDVDRDPAAVAELVRAIADGDYRIAPVNAGQGVGDVNSVEPAAAVIERLCAEALEVIQRG